MCTSPWADPKNCKFGQIIARTSEGGPKELEPTKFCHSMALNNTLADKKKDRTKASDLHTTQKIFKRSNNSQLPNWKWEAEVTAEDLNSKNCCCSGLLVKTGVSMYFSILVVCYTRVKKSSFCYILVFSCGVIFLREFWSVQSQELDMITHP